MGGGTAGTEADTCIAIAGRLQGAAVKKPGIGVASGPKNWSTTTAGDQHPLEDTLSRTQANTKHMPNGVQVKKLATAWHLTHFTSMGYS